ncbi:type II toxin-antitoxin system RelE/ParE family toxin [Dyadobacter sp. CY343]|uniref:type II toxin-antitoxin system RelE/ParE family toxin n=1 Tax=Dyadobacter sp. CY343 TaxID=2907299 RepID=UPI001F337D0D|nr:type II toxin-antitoxin system RelE/ParE family toxin [Dyadobacter sp. CY343]MCE7061846.1 type II toxin-antitoxin system RelE/ParE family toxin [Dyadobacter sp. CY343]
MKSFQILLLEDAEEFLATLTREAAAKIVFNISLAQSTNDPRLLKKLTDEIWEFRTRYQGQQIRLLAFWDKTNKQKTLVVATHGFVKKVDKVPGKEIKRALTIRKQYFAQLDD